MVIYTCPCKQDHGRNLSCSSILVYCESVMVDMRRRAFSFTQANGFRNDWPTAESDFIGQDQNDLRRTISNLTSRPNAWAEIEQLTRSKPQFYPRGESRRVCHGIDYHALPKPSSPPLEIYDAFSKTRDNTLDVLKQFALASVPEDGIIGCLAQMHIFMAAGLTNVDQLPIAERYVGKNIRSILAALTWFLWIRDVVSYAWINRAVMELATLVNEEISGVDHFSKSRRVLLHSFSGLRQCSFTVLCARVCNTRSDHRWITKHIQRVVTVEPSQDKPLISLQTALGAYFAPYSPDEGSKRPCPVRACRGQLQHVRTIVDRHPPRMVVLFGRGAPVSILHGIELDVVLTFKSPSWTSTNVLYSIVAITYTDGSVMRAIFKPRGSSWHNTVESSHEQHNDQLGDILMGLDLPSDVRIVCLLLESDT